MFDLIKKLFKYTFLKDPIKDMNMKDMCGNPAIPFMNPAIWDKQGEWCMYKQYDLPPVVPMGDKIESGWLEIKPPQNPPEIRMEASFPPVIQIDTPPLPDIKIDTSQIPSEIKIRDWAIPGSPACFPQKLSDPVYMGTEIPFPVIIPDRVYPCVDRVQSQSIGDIFGLLSSERTNKLLKLIDALDVDKIKKLMDLVDINQDGDLVFKIGKRHV